MEGPLGNISEMKSIYFRGITKIQKEDVRSKI